MKRTFSIYHSRTHVGMVYGDAVKVDYLQSAKTHIVYIMVGSCVVFSAMMDDGITVTEIHMDGSRTRPLELLSAVFAASEVPQPELSDAEEELLCKAQGETGVTLYRC